METVTAKEAAALLGVNTRTVHRLLKAGELQGHKKTLAINSSFVIARASLDAFIARRDAAGSAQSGPADQQNGKRPDHHRIV